MSDIAVVDDQDLTAGDEEQLVTMTVDSQLFGIPILMVQDIVEPDQITPVPRAPSAIAGVLNLRGRIVTVIDLRECLGSAPDDEDKQMSVTVEHKGDLYTLLVDSIGDVRSLPRKSFDKPPATLDDSLKRVCSGIFRLEGDLLVVLDVEKILDEETIMKTPRRTRRRRKVELTQVAVNKKETASAKKVEPAPAEDEEAEEAPARPAAAPRASASKPAAAAPANSDDTPAAAEAPAEEPAPAAAPAEEPAPAAAPAEEPAPAAAPAPSSGNAEQQALQAVEAYAARIDSDPVLKDLLKDVNDADLLDLLLAVFNAAFGVSSTPSLQDAYLALIKQPGLADDHFVSAATNMHAVLTEMGVTAEESDRVMQVVDQARILVLDS